MLIFDTFAVYYDGHSEPKSNEILHALDDDRLMASQMSRKLARRAPRSSGGTTLKYETKVLPYPVFLLDLLHMGAKVKVTLITRIKRTQT